MACLRQYAPTWLAHLPALGRPDELVAVAPAMPGATQARMLRELAEALEALAVEALALLARRRDAARLLAVGTCRPVELILHDHPLKRVKQELAAHGQCVEIPLGGLSPQAVAAYVAQRRGTLAGHDAVAAFVYRCTEGHPLFMVQVVDYLAQQHLLQAPVQAAGSSTGSAMDQVMPPEIHHLIEAQVGGVAGAEFAGASVAAGRQTAPDAVEAVCEQLARQGQFLEDQGLIEWPDGTVSGCYGFRHALYQEVVYQRLGAGHRESRRGGLWRAGGMLDALCQQVGDTERLFPVLLGLSRFHRTRAELQTAQELAAHALALAQHQHTPELVAHAHITLGISLFHQGELGAARGHLAQGSRRAPASPPPSWAYFSEWDRRVSGLAFLSLSLWLLGYPDQARHWNAAAITEAQALAHPSSLAFAQIIAAMLQQMLRAKPAVRPMSRPSRAWRRSTRYCSGWPSEPPWGDGRTTTWDRRPCDARRSSRGWTPITPLVRR